MFISGELWRAPFLAGLTYPLLFLIGPSFFLYTKKLWNSDYKIKWEHLVLLLPTAWALWDSRGWILFDLSEKSEILKNIEPWAQPEIPLMGFIKFGVLIVHTAIYLGLVVKDLKSYQSMIKDSVSNNKQVLKLSWLRKLTKGLFIYVTGFFITMVLLASTKKYGLLIDRAWVVVLTFFVHTVGFLAIQQSYFFSREADREEGTSFKEESGENKYKKSPLEESSAEKIFIELKRVMEEEKLYLNPDLKASELAQILEIPLYQFSHLLSLKSEYNFFDFVNEYRVNEAKSLLKDSSNDHLTILAIGFEAGFNNKSSFNRAFKKFTGETPSAYKKESILA